MNPNGHPNRFLQITPHTTLVITPQMEEAARQERRRRWLQRVELLFRWGAMLAVMVGGLVVATALLRLL